MNEVAADWLGRIQPYFETYGCWLVFTALFLENVMFLGAVVPGAVVLVIGGWLARQEQVSPYSLALAGIVGTIAGDTVSYFIGRRAGDRLLQSERWGKAVAAVSARVRTEPALLTFCHFVSYLRMVVPMTAGISRVPFRRWLPLDAIGATLWVTSHVAVGYFLSLSTASATGERLSLSVLGLLVVFFAVRYLAKTRASRRAEAAVDAKPDR